MVPVARRPSEDYTTFFLLTVPPQPGNRIFECLRSNKKHLYTQVLLCTHPPVLIFKLVGFFTLGKVPKASSPPSYRPQGTSKSVLPVYSHIGVWGRTTGRLWVGEPHKMGARQLQPQKGRFDTHNPPKRSEKTNKTVFTSNQNGPQSRGHSRLEYSLEQPRN